jgi:hypothetical protein
LRLVYAIECGLSMGVYQRFVFLGQSRVSVNCYIILGEEKNIWKNLGIIADMIFAFWNTGAPLIIGVRGFIFGEPPRITPVRRK